MATHITKIPTIITTTVAPTGTATFKSTQSGIQGKNCLTSGMIFSGGATVPKRINKEVVSYLTFVVRWFSTQHTDDYNRNNYDQNGGNYRNYQIQVWEQNFYRVFVGKVRNFASWCYSTCNSLLKLIRLINIQT